MVRRMLFLLTTTMALLFSTPLPAAEWALPPEAPDMAARLDPPPAAPRGWVTLHGLYARVHAPSSLAGQAQRLANPARSVPEIARRLDLPAGRTMDVYLADSDATFRELQPGRVPAWADATAWPQRTLIFLRDSHTRGGVARPIEQVLDHEITHVLLGEAFGARPVPSWLQEGLAQWVAGEYGPETTRQIASGLLGRGLLSLKDLGHGFPDDPLRARLAYAQSADLIGWLVAEHGLESVHTLTHALSRGAPFTAAFREATGEYPEDLDARWRSRLDNSLIWLEPLTGDGVWWGIAVLGLMAATFTVRRRNHLTRERWRKEERLEALLLRLHRIQAWRRQNLEGQKAPPPKDVWEDASQTRH